jgi:Uma2 family endonuclease
LPSETRRTINRKLTHYLKGGVKEVWIVDPESREAETWTSLAIPERTLTCDDSLGSPLLSGFSLKIADLFL